MGIPSSLDPVRLESSSPRVDDVGCEGGHASPVRDDGHSRSEPADPERRTILAGLTAALMAAFARSATAQADPAAGRRGFMDVSKLLTGRSTLDATDADRLYDALSAARPRFDAEVQALLNVMRQRRIDP